MNIVKWFKERRKRRERDRLLSALRTETGTMCLQAVNDALRVVDPERFTGGYRKSVGELIRVEFSLGPLALLEAANLFADVIQNDDYIPQSFAHPERQETNLDSWLTVDGAYVRTTAWYPRMCDAVEALLIAMRSAEVCATDKSEYYLRRSKMLLRDLAELSRVLITLEGR